MVATKEKKADSGYTLVEEDRQRISTFIELHYGIQMPVEKKILLQSRLQRRSLQLGYTSIRAYIDYLFSPVGQVRELDHFAGLVTTHKTDFFREMEHFTWLDKIVLPDLQSKHRALGINEPLVIWSTASSTGEEVYSFAMTVDHYFKTHNRPGAYFRAIGTDIADHIAEKAGKGIYPATSLINIPEKYRHYCMISKNPQMQLIRIVPELRAMTDFRVQNLMDMRYKVKGGIHIIFCRNVLIYFNKYTQYKILKRITKLLAPGGYLFTGHSETLTGMDLPLKPVRTTLYKKDFTVS